MILDWLEITYRVVDLEDIRAIFDHIEFLFGDLLHSERSFFRGYDNGATTLDGLCRVGYSFKRLEMGVHVELKGQALAYINSLNDPMFETPTKVLEVLLYHPAADKFGEGVEPVKISRADWALDDYEGVLNLAEIVRLNQAWRDGETVISSRMRRGRVNDGGYVRQPQGASCYFGEGQSNTIVKFYDKRVESERFDLAHWVRCELVTRNDRALGLIKEVLARGAVAVSEYILNYVRFLDLSEVDSESNVSRVPTAEWWADFLGTTEKLVLSLPKVVKTVQKVADWVQSQVAPSLALLAEAFGGDGVLELFRADGEMRLKKTHQEMIKRFKRSVNDRELLDFVRSLGGRTVDDLAWSDYTERKRQAQRKPKMPVIPDFKEWRHGVFTESDRFGNEIVSWNIAGNSFVWEQ